MQKIIQFKETVRIKRWTPAIRYMLDMIEGIMSSNDWVPELTITSINDSKHKENSQHYKDLALDVRSHNFLSHEDRLRFLEVLKTTLGPKFFVDLENINTPNEHFHMQLHRTETFE